MSRVGAAVSIEEHRAVAELRLPDELISGGCPLIL
jgi:hypothetical protein